MKKLKIFCIVTIMMTCSKAFTQVYPPVSNTSNWSCAGPIQYPVCVSATGCLGAGSVGVGRIACLAFHPTNTNIIYAGATHGGLWKSMDNGLNWSSMNSDQIDKISISSISISQLNPNVMYIATGESGSFQREGSLYGGYYGSSTGVYKSIDGGTTWNPTSLNETNANSIFQFPISWSNTKRITKLLVDPSDSTGNTAYVGFVCRTYEWANIPDPANSYGGIYKTTDGGVTWTIILGNAEGTSNTSGFPITSIWDMEFQPGNPGVIYAGGARLFKSTNYGATWSDVTGVLNYNTILNNYIPALSRILIEVTPANPNNIYVSALYFGGAPDGYEGLWVNTDMLNTAGATTKKNNANTANGINNCNGVLTVSMQSPNKIFSGGYILGISTDYGDNFTIPNSYFQGKFHVDIRDIKTRTVASVDEIWLATDGGIYMSNDNGSTFSKPISGLAVTEFLDISVSNDGTIFGGTRDNAAFYSSPGATDIWKMVNGGGDGGITLIDPLQRNTLYWRNGGGVFGASYLNRSYDGGLSYTNIVPPGVSGYIGALVFDPVNSNTIYCGADNLYKSTNNGTSWSASIIPSGMLPAAHNSISCIAISPSDPNVVYVSDGSEDLVSNSSTTFILKCVYSPGSGTWTVTSMNLSSLTSTLWDSDRFALSGIAVHSTNSNIVYICYEGFYTGVYKYDGSSWSDYGTGLPIVSKKGIVIDKTSPVMGMYVGTDVGVFYTDNTLNGVWQNFDDGLPNVRICDLEINYSQRMIYAGTYGRGVWKSTLACPTIPNDITLTAGTAATNQFAHLSITGASSIVVPSNVSPTYTAGVYVQWNPNFTICPGAGQVVTAVIDPTLNCLDMTQAGHLRMANLNSTNDHQLDADNVSSAPSLFSVYPNPSQNSVTLNYEKLENSVCNVSVLDMAGENKISYYNKKFENGRLTIDISPLFSGMYIVRINSAEGTFNKKITVIK